jgi:hypothetical protein
MPSPVAEIGKHTMVRRASFLGIAAVAQVAPLSSLPSAIVAVLVLIAVLARPSLGGEKMVPATSPVVERSASEDLASRGAPGETH